MFGNARRIVLRTTSLVVLLVLGTLTWPSGLLQGQEKEVGVKQDQPENGLPKTAAPVTGQPGPQVIGPSSVQAAPQPAPTISQSIEVKGGGRQFFPQQPGGFSGSGSSMGVSQNFVPNPPNVLVPPMQPPQRFSFTIDPKTSLKDLLPAIPKVKNIGLVLTDDLTQIPEVEFGAPVVKDAEAMKNTAYMIARINHLNGKKADGFLEALRDERSDLHGMPFAMGDACRTKGERNRYFTSAVGTVRAFLQPGNPAENFWAQYLQNCAQNDAAQGKLDRPQQEHATLARIAALMQILAPESAGLRLGLVKHLASISHAEATHALAKLAIFSTEEEVRQAAIDVLKVRRERDYTDILLQGMRYPWPAVAKRSAEALVKLERTDLIPQLVDLLDEPDPRSPVMKEIEKKKVPVVREMVRVNHHRNCLLCHAPGNTGTVGAGTLTVGVPTPDQPLNPPSGGYNQGSSPDLLVRLDVTYLRQDFSAFQAVADAAPWPEMQRFDFLVRTRELTEKEAAVYREKLENREKGKITPYQRAAVTALRELTGKDTSPTAVAWRDLLELSSKRRN